MIQDYRCTSCNKLLFRGSLSLIVSKAQQPQDAIELKCPRCNAMNIFVPEATILKTRQAD